VCAVLALNCGSSSLKFQVVEVDDSGRAAARPARGGVSAFGPQAEVTLQLRTDPALREKTPVPDHRAAVELVLDWLAKSACAVDAVAHRIVHGGPKYAASVLIDDGVLRALEAVEALAPLHNAPSVAAVRAARAALGPAVPMAAVFDTGFHAGMPAAAREYAIPRDLAWRHGIHRYGFHGTSFRSVLRDYGRLSGRAADADRVVALHLGSGCSAAAVDCGRSIDTSMGFTPLEGLIMGTRSGDADPAIVGYLSRAEGVPVDEVERWLNERSGLRGLGGTHDMRALLDRAAADPDAQLAVESFCYRARKYVGAYLAALGGAEALVFTGAIGERAPEVRRRICAPLGWLGVELDEAENAAAIGVAARLSPDGARLPVWVIPTDEERVMAEDTAALLATASGAKAR
jgi:acetate kinase